mgnify:CR=1 FL=1
MKKLFIALVAFLTLCACSSDDKKQFEYRNLALSMPFKTICDSLQARGFVVDSAHSDSAGNMVVMGNPAANYRLVLAQRNDTLLALQENYALSTNDSTRRLWQELHDQFEKQLGSWPNMTKHGDDHKVAKFEDDGGFITLTLKNTYTPTLSVLYEPKN